MAKKSVSAAATSVDSNMPSNKNSDSLFSNLVYDVRPESYDFKIARSEIRAQDGRIIFSMDNIRVPEDWSQVAVDILAQKYFRKQGVPNKTTKVPQANVPQWLWPSVPAEGAEFGAETDAMQVFHRLAGCWTYWGWKGKYFRTEAQAKAFYSQMVCMLFAQICAPNSPQWFNTGLHWAYGIDGPSQGHYYYDVIRAGTTHQDPVVEAKTSYERPQTSACQPYNALISTPNGLMKIGDIVTKNLIGTKVYDSNDITKVVAVKANGIKKVYRITLQSGHTVEATADHLILVSDRKGRSAEYKALADIEPGDYLTYRANTTIKNSKVSKRLEAEAFLAGWLQSDGFVGQYTHGTNQSLTLEFITVNSDEYDAVKSALSIVFPKEHYNIINVSSENSELDIWRIRLYGEQFKDFVSKYNLMARGVDTEVPEDILHGPLPIQQAYLNAVFQADGYVSTREASPVIGLAMISTTLVNQIHLMLANMGIYSRICTKVDSRSNRHDMRCINIQVESERAKFGDLIGFVSEEKTSKVVSTLNGSGRAVGKTKWFKVERIEYIGKQEVYDIQTESEHYLCGNIVVHNCFIQSIKDDLVNTNGIMDTFLKEARLFKYGSGTGTNFSNLRGSGEKLSGGGRSSGVMSFLKIGDVSAGSIKSGGTTRRAAKMVLLDIDHPDIETFIDWKVKEERKVAAIITGAKINKKFLQEVYDARVQNDERALSKAIGNARKNFVSDNYIHRTIQQADMGADFTFEEFNTDFNSEAYSTVSGQNSNNSIRISDSFMNLTLLDGDKDDSFNLINRTDGAVNKQVSAKQIWRKICEAAWHSADPGIQFDDTINEWHTCKTAGRINASNPCSEYMFLDDTACNLASINLIKFITETGGFDYPKFAKVCQLWQLVLEISVYMSQFPAHDIALNSYLYRTTGLGFANIGGMLMNMAIPYDSQEAMYLCSAISAIMTGAAYQQSVNMAKSLEPFRGYHENKASMLEVLHKHNAKIATTIGTLKADTFLEEHSPGIGAFAKEIWENVVVNATKYGVRNAQVSVIAPTGTIGLLMDCDTTGIEPDFAIVKFKKLAGGGYMKIVNSTVDTALKRLGYAPTEIEEIETYATGTKALPSDVAELFMKMGATKEDITVINKKLVTAFDLNFILNRTVLGDDLMTRIGADDKIDSAIDILRHIRFIPDASKQSQVAINNLNNTIVGMMTLEGAPYLRHEHYPIFACASKTGTIGKQIISSMGHLNMMAAAQPFISGAISKTINLPHEATINDIDRVYRTAWRLGLKSIALYRDGSKLAQPLASSVLEAFDISKYELEENNVTAVKLMTEAIHKSMRRKLPPRRRGYTQKVKIANQALYIKTGEYGDGTLGEIFLDVNKEGASFRAMMNSFAIAVSIGLQYGVPLEEFVDAFVGTKFEPAGIVTGNDCIKMSTSIVDYIFRELAISYLDRADDFAQVKPAIDLPINNPLPIKEGFNRGIPRTVKEEKRPQTPSITPVVTPAVAHAVETQEAHYVAAKARGYTGDSCPSCGSMTMVRNGTCLKCENCGTTTGCS